MRLLDVGMSVAVMAAIGPCSSGPAHPEPNPRGGYAIEVSVSGSEFQPVTTGSEGEGCERFDSNEDAERACFIATNLIPTIIGGEAYGDLNERRTPALDALIWRARASADPTICARGGLSGDYRSECERDAIADDYEYVSGSFRVRVPIGGAQPSFPAQTPD